MEAEKTLNKIRKLKPTNDNVKKNPKKNALYKMISTMYEKNYNLKMK